MKLWWALITFLFIVIILGTAALVLIPSPKEAKTPTATSTLPATLADLMVVSSPLPDATVSSPLMVRGEARGSWFFEATARTELLDASGTVIAQAPSQAQGDWMTNDYVPFTATLTFPPQPKGSSGTLIVKNDNPSGDPSKEKELDIPVFF